MASAAILKYGPNILNAHGTTKLNIKYHLYFCCNLTKMRLSNRYQTSVRLPGSMVRYLMGATGTLAVMRRLELKVGLKKEAST